MIPSFIITFREVIEATLIVATILGILTKLGNKDGVKVVWSASAFAVIVSLILLVTASIFGYSMRNIYTGVLEEVIEGSLMIISAIFITWAVFFLHKYFASYKVKLLQKIKNVVSEKESNALFLLTFTAVFREGFEIILFLSTVYLTESPEAVLSGALAGITLGLFVSLGIFTATVKIPIYYTFKVTSILLVLFAAGLLGRGFHEFAEIGLLPELGKVTFAFLPEKGSILGDISKSVFGLTDKMDGIQTLTYFMYISFMTWYLYFRDKTKQLFAK